MRRFVCIVVLVCCLALSGCGGGRGETNPGGTDSAGRGSVGSNGGQTNDSQTNGGQTNGGGLLWGDFHYDYDHAGEYTVGGGEVSEPVRHLDIDWVSGSVNVVRSSGSRIEFREETDKELSDDLIMRWRLDGDTLYLKFCNSGKWKLDKLQKTLTVTLPKDLLLDSVEIDTTSAAINAPELYAGEVEFDTTSGDVAAQLFTARELDLSTVSGNAEVTVRDSIRQVKAETVSGEISLALAAVGELDVETVSGKIEIAAEKIEEAELGSTSSQVGLTLEQPGGKCEIGTISGDVVLTLPADARPVVRYDTVSGEFSSELEISDGKRGSGSTVYEVDTTSGDLTVLSKP